MARGVGVVVAVEVWATDAIWLDCCLGLKQHERWMQDNAGDMASGATAGSIAFATAIKEGFPVDIGTVAEVLEAHRALAARSGAETRQQRCARLLWGGDTAVEWARDAVAVNAPRPAPTTPPPAPEPAAAPAPVAADAHTDGTRTLENLADQIFQLEQEAIAALTAAFWVAYRQALRAAGRQAKARSQNTVPLAAQANAGLTGNDLDTARTRIKTACPFTRWNAAGPQVLAAISADLDAAVADALEDYEDTADGILEQLTTAIIAAIALALSIPRTDVELLAPDLLARSSAVTFGSAGLHEWVRDRLSGDRDPATLPELSVPAQLPAEMIGIAGGATVARDGQTVGGPIVERVIQGVTAGTIASNVLTGLPLPRRRWTWVRGAPSDPHPFHEDFDGRSWTSDEERNAQVGSAEPTGAWACQCRIKRSWEIRRA